MSEQEDSISSAENFEKYSSIESKGNANTSSNKMNRTISPLNTTGLGSAVSMINLSSSSNNSPDPPGKSSNSYDLPRKATLTAKSISQNAASSSTFDKDIQYRRLSYSNGHKLLTPSSSSNSSRRPSIPNIMQGLNSVTTSNLPKLSSQKQFQQSNVSSLKSEYNENPTFSDSNPFVSMTPERRSFVANSFVSPTHSSKTSTLSLQDRTASLQMDNSNEDLFNLNNKVLSRQALSSGKFLSNQRLFERQYILNEKKYLEGMKKLITDDDYYTKTVSMPPIELDEEDENENDNHRGSDDSNELFDINIDRLLKLKDYEPVDHENYVYDVNISDLGTHRKSNTNSISPLYILNKLQWLNSIDPENQFVIEILNELSKVEGIDNFGSNMKLTEIIQNLFHQSKVADRFEWLTMLTNVLKGDIVRSEKTKLAKEKSGIDSNLQYADDIWLELRAWMNGRSKDDQERSLKILRDNTDSFFAEIMAFKIQEGVSRGQSETIVNNFLQKYFRAINLWPNMKKLHVDKPITNTQEFILRVESLIGWQNSIENYKSKKTLLEEWIGINDLANFFENDLKNEREKFTELLIKERDIETIFQKKIFFPLAPGILKAKIFYLNNRELLKEMNLIYSNDELSSLLLFPIKLIKAVILLRIEYAKKLQNPTMMMIDQMIDDFTSYIRLSVQLKATLMEYSIGWPFPIELEPEFDKTVVEAIHYLYILVQLKILDNSDQINNSFRESESLIKYWDELKNVGPYIDGAAIVIANGFSKLTLRLLQRLNSNLNFHEDKTLDLLEPQDAEKLLTHNLDNSGSMKRKLNRFSNLITKAFENSATFKIDDSDTLLTSLQNSDHFLIYSGGQLEDNGIYLIGSSELLGVDDETLMKILNSSDIGSDLIPKLSIENSLSIYNALKVQRDPELLLRQHKDDEGVPYHNIGNSNDITNEHEINSEQPLKTQSINKINKRINKKYSQSKRTVGLPLNSSPVEDAERELFELEIRLHSLGYILVLIPDKPLLWEGQMYNLSSKSQIKFKEFPARNYGTNTITLVNQGSCYALEYQCNRFQQILGSTASFVERKCFSENIEMSLSRINKMHFSCTHNILTNYPIMIEKFKPLCKKKDFLNGIFLFVRDFCNVFLNTTVHSNEKKSLIILLMVKLSVDWLTYLVEDCDPTDPKTFRWCVTAMEFTLQIITGLNILVLDEHQFKSLKQKIAACMSLLISHFDVMGARVNEVEKAHQQTRANVEMIDDFDVDTMLQINSKLRLKSISKLEENVRINPHQIGKVLDVTVKTDKYLTTLASSISNVSIRWQKRNFIGGGTFGAVYSAVNLDNGDILAVKEIKIQDSKTMENIFPSLKEEMSVLEMMNHPNIIQYYGVEVHRDKVNIFMECCEGGSLASLLEHGRFEDEMVTQIYTLELLEGLAYLHESGVVHRDIKPENILLDFNGIIKYVDFGAARKIIKNRSIKRTSTSNNSLEIMDSSSTSEHKKDEENKHNMLGTPMYMAPETIAGSENKGRFGADDIWSLGCVVLEMITGKRPWSNLDNEWAVMYHVAAGQIPPLPAKDEVSEAGRNFLKRCLIQDPNKRATSVELLMDPWIIEIRDIAFGDSEQMGDNNEY